MLTYFITCPNCVGSLVPRDECYECKECGVIVKASEGGWRYPRESELRPLPGLMGRLLYRTPSVSRRSA